jgi:hypothetical protein
MKIIADGVFADYDLGASKPLIGNGLQVAKTGLRPRSGSCDPFIGSSSW